MKIIIHLAYCTTVLWTLYSQANNDSSHFKLHCREISLPRLHIDDYFRLHDRRQPMTKISVRAKKFIHVQHVNEIVATVREVFHFFRGTLTLPRKIEIDAYTTHEGNHVNSKEGLMIIGYTDRPHEDPMIISKGSIHHEAGHVLFGENVVIDGKSFNTEFNEAVQKMLGWQKILEERNNLLYDTIWPIGDQIQSAKADGKNDEVARLKALYAKKLKELGGTAKEAQKQFFNWAREKDKFFEGPARAYNELWGDLITVTLAGNPSAMVDELKTYAKSKERSAQELLRIGQRDFSRPYHHRFHDLIDDPYTILDFSRNYIWEHYLANTTIEQKRKIANVLLKVMEFELNSYFRGEFESDYHILNKRLMTKFNAAMGRPNLPVEIDLKTNIHYYKADPNQFPGLWSRVK
jgi:hypothetical protein